MAQSEKEYSQIIGSLSTIVIAVIAFLLPVIFLTNTTEFFTFPKQILIIAGAFILLALYSLKSITEKRLTFVKNPLNLPVFIFAIIIIVSSYASQSSIIALPQVASVIGAIIIFFTAINLINERQNFNIVLFSLITGTILGAVLTTLASFQIHLLPFEQTKNEFFNTLGSPIQMIAFIIPIIILTLAAFLVKYQKHGKLSLRKIPTALYGITFILLTIVIGLVIYQITSADSKPVLLPLEHGFQLALAQISQNAQRLLPSFLLGSGYATFSNVFTKFHLASFNVLPSWNLTFSLSSSYALELIATTGILGFMSYFFIIVRFIRSNTRFNVRPLFLSTASLIALSFILPFSFTLVALLFLLLALHIISLRLVSKSKSVDEIVVSLVTKGGSESNAKRGDLILPFIVSALSVGLIIYSLFFLVSRDNFEPKGLYHYVISDINFAKSLQPDALASGQQTYDLQIKALQQYPYRADFYRVFAQINIALATNLANSQADAPTVSEEVQQAIIQRLQQAINSSRQAVILAPESSLNWRNLGQIYRNLVGVGQDAEQFAIASYNQAIALNPNSPTLRIELGGIYYQLKEFDLAQNQFQIAVSLKPNYANAHYNLGHALEEKGQLTLALQQYQITKQLVANDVNATTGIDGEITILQGKIGEEAQIATEEDIEPTDDTQIEIQTPQTQFPERDPLEQIPPPPGEEDENVEEDEDAEEEKEEEPSPTPTG